MLNSFGKFLFQGVKMESSVNLPIDVTADSEHGVFKNVNIGEVENQILEFVVLNIPIVASVGSQVEVTKHVQDHCHSQLNQDQELEEIKI